MRSSLQRISAICGSINFLVNYMFTQSLEWTFTNWYVDTFEGENLEAIEKIEVSWREVGCVGTGCT